MGVHSRLFIGRKRTQQPRAADHAFRRGLRAIKAGVTKSASV